MTLIETSLGPMPLDRLRKCVKVTATAREATERTEYYFEGVCVRSDVHIKLKQGLGLEQLLTGQIG